MRCVERSFVVLLHLAESHLVSIQNRHPLPSSATLSFDRLSSDLDRLSRLADVEARDQAMLDPEDVTDHPVSQHRSPEVAHCLVDLDDDLAISAG